MGLSGKPLGDGIPFCSGGTPEPAFRRIQKSCWIQGLGLRPWDSGFRVEGLGLFLNPLFLGFRV